MRAHCVLCALVVSVASACGDDGAVDGSTASSSTTTATDTTVGPSTSGTSSSDTTGDTMTGCDADQYACADGCCDCAGPGVVTAISLGVTVDLATAADLDGDALLDLVVAGAGGLASFRGVACGGFEPATSTLAGQTWTGLAAADLDGTGADDIVAFADGGTLYALGGIDLAELWSDAVAGLGSSGAVLAAHLDTDGDHDVAAFDATYGSLLRVENTGSGWSVRATVALPPGISEAGAGDLGANARDEILFLGGGLVEVISVADFDFSNVQPLSGSAHAGSAVDDVTGDGTGDALIGAGSTLEVWAGNSATALASMADSIALPSPIVDVAVRTPGADVAVLAGSTLALVDTAGGLTPAAEAALDGPALAVFTGDVDGDQSPDVVAVGGDGMAYLWRP